MEIGKFRHFLLDRGMVWHRKLYYILVLPAVLVLWRELLALYRNNLLAWLVLAYVAYMMATLLWTSNFTPQEALATLGYGLAVLSFCFISGYLWTEQGQRMDHLAHRSLWLAAGAALVSIVAWYSQNPFPSSRIIHGITGPGALYPVAHRAGGSERGITGTGRLPRHGCPAGHYGHQLGAGSQQQ
jgi:hypothetical protein